MGSIQLSCFFWLGMRGVATMRCLPVASVCPDGARPYGVAHRNCIASLAFLLAGEEEWPTCRIVPQNPEAIGPYCQTHGAWRGYKTIVGRNDAGAASIMEGASPLRNIS